MDARERYFILSKEGRNGPYSVAELAAFFRDGKISANTPLLDADTREGLSVEVLFGQPPPTAETALGSSAASGEELNPTFPSPDARRSPP